MFGDLDLYASRFARVMIPVHDAMTSYRFILEKKRKKLFKLLTDFSH